MHFLVVAAALAGAPPTEAPICDAAKAMTARAGRAFVVDAAVPCASMIRVPDAGVAKDEAAKRFVKGAVAAGHVVVEGATKTTIGTTDLPGWLADALAQCPIDENAQKPLWSMQLAVDASGAVTAAHLEATSHEGRPRGRCLLDRARLQKLTGGAATWTFPLAGAQRAGPIPADFKARMDEMKKERDEASRARDQAEAQKALAPPDAHAH